MWRDRETGQIVHTHADIRLMRANWLAPSSITDDMIEFAGFDPVVISEPPAVDAEHIAYPEAAAQNAAGTWVSTWATRLKTPEEIAAGQPVIPVVVSRRQGLRALFLMYGLKKEDIDAAIDAHPAMSTDEKYLAKIDFEDAQTFERFSPLVLAMGVALELDLDALFWSARATT